MLLHSFDYPPCDGGISRLCAEIAAGFVRRGTGVRVVTQACEGGSRVPDGAAVTRVSPLRPKRELDAFREISRGRGSDLVLCGVWYPEGLLALLSGSKNYIVLAHGSELMPTSAWWRRALWKRLLRMVLTRARLVVGDSEYSRRLALSEAPECRAVSVPLAVDHVRFSPGDRDAARRAFGVAGKLVIGSVSRIHAYKGHEVALEALSRLPDGVRDGFVYLVAGKGPDVGLLQRKARTLGVDHLVRWLGYVAEDRLPELYRALDLFLLCTRETAHRQEVEGFGLVFLEAQASGTPVVGTRTGGIPDAVADGDGGWLIGQDDSHAMSGIFRRLADDPEEFRRAGKAARARVEREFTWNHYVIRLDAALKAEGLSVG